MPVTLRDREGYANCSLLLLMWIASYIKGDLGQVARIAMFLPVGALALRHGWFGAAIGGSLASGALVAVMPAPHDPVTMQAEVFMAFTITTMLVLGARIAMLDEQKGNAQRALQHQATHDMLTGLPNRRLFHDHLRTALQRELNCGGDFALVLFDLDGFKAINDQYGHPMGDALLQMVAARLSGALRANDSVARLGGDEFALILEGVIDVEALLERCRQLAAALAMPYRLIGRYGKITLRVSSSVGIALGVGHDDDEHLIQAADQALHQAKAAGKNRCVLADTAIKHPHRRNTTETE